MKILKKQKNKQQGFSLIESLLSITILMISVAVPMTMAWSGLLAAYLAEDQIVAFYLAQDAIEYVRNKRDYNKLSRATNMLDDIFDDCEVNSVSGMDDPGGAGNSGCNLNTFAAVTGVVAEEGSYGTNPKNLCYHPDGGQYDYTFPCESPNTESKFLRQVRVGYIDADLSEAVVEVTMSWPNDVDVMQEYKLRTHLKDW